MQLASCRERFIIQNNPQAQLHRWHLWQGLVISLGHH